MNIEKWLARLENESKALKQGFYQPATSIPLHTRSTSITTIPNVLSGFYAQPTNATERVLVTFTTKAKMPTIAQLEMKSSAGAKSRVRRTNYAHGAQWVIYRDSITPWAPTSYEFTVHSMLDGELKAENVGA